MKKGKKRGAERTQIATRNEEWSDERLKQFLIVKPPSDMPVEYNILLKAYRGMTAELFERFLKLYLDAGHDVNCKHPDGSTLYDLVSKHRKSIEYAKVLKSAGALSKKT